MAQTKACLTCGQGLDSSAKVCPFCGAGVPMGTSKKLLIGAAVVVGMALLTYFGTGYYWKTTTPSMSSGPGGPAEITNNVQPVKPGSYDAAAIKNGTDKAGTNLSWLTGQQEMLVGYMGDLDFVVPIAKKAFIEVLQVVYLFL